LEALGGNIAAEKYRPGRGTEQWKKIFGIDRKNYLAVSTREIAARGFTDTLRRKGEKADNRLFKRGKKKEGNGTSERKKKSAISYKGDSSRVVQETMSLRI